MYYTIYSYKDYEYEYEASRGAAAKSVTVKPTGCEFDPISMW